MSRQDAPQIITEEERRRQRGIPPNAIELSEQEVQREFANTFVYALLDLIAAIGSLMLFTVHQRCSLPLNFWLFTLALMAFGSLGYHINLMYEIKHNYTRNKTVIAGYIIEVVLFVWFIVG